MIASFTINGFGYFGTGKNLDGVYLQDFWRYDPATDSWNQMQDFAGPRRYLAVGFAIGSKGYIGTGNIGNDQALVGANDFYEYDPATNAWINRQSVGFSGRISSVGFTIGGKGYVTTGFNGNNYAAYDNTAWEFDPTQNSWTQKANFAGGSRDAAGAFAVNGNGYVVSGQFNDPNQVFPLYYRDTWQFNPTTNIWSAKALLPEFFSMARGFSIGSKGYIVAPPLNFAVSKLWMYDPTLDSWSAKVTYPKSATYHTTFQICNVAFVTGDSFSREVWKFTEDASIIGPTLVCNSASYSIGNLPSGASISWSSSNPNGLSINPTSGLATRVNNFNGQVTITATISGGTCNYQSTSTVYVGVPATPGQLLQPISPMCVNQTKSANIAVVLGATSFTWWSNDPNLDVGNGTFWTSDLVTAYAAGTHFFTIKSNNSCGSSSTRQYNVGVVSCGGGASLVMASPNPASTTLTVETILSSPTADAKSSRTIDGLWLRNDQGTLVMLSSEKSSRIMLQISSLPKGFYYLTVKMGDDTEVQRIVIDR